MTQSRNIDNETLNAVVSGGWNVISNAMTMPQEDSPEINNISIDDTGAVRKRSGFSLEYTYTGTASNTFNSMMVPVQFANGLEAFMVRRGDDMVVHHKDPTGTWQTKDLLYMFGANAVPPTRVNYIVTRNDLYSAVLFVGSGFMPTSVIMIEGSDYESAGVGGITSVTIETPSTIATGTTCDDDEFWMWFKETTTGTVLFRQPTNHNKSGTTSTFTVSNVPQGTYLVTWVYFCPVIWAEALRVDSDMVFNSTVQGVSSAHLPVPESLLFGIDHLYNSVSNRVPYPLDCYSSTNFDTVFTDTNPPTTSAQWWTTSGSLGGGGTSPESPYFVSFGAAPAANRDVLFHRGFEVGCNGGRGFNAQANAVTATWLHDLPSAWGRYSVAAPSHGGAGTGGTQYSFYLRTDAYAQSTSSSATTFLPFISFDATATANGGVALHTDDVLMVTNNFVGRLGDINAINFTSPDVLSSVLSNMAANLGVPYFVPQDLYPYFGLWEWIDTYNGSFPSVIGTLQGRVVIGGFDADPLRIVFSTPGDSSVPGLYQNDFQVRYARGNVTDAFDVLLPGDTDEYITAIKEWNDNLFVWTNKNVYRVFAPEGIVTYQNVTYSTMGAVGCLNQRCVVLTDNSLVFMAGRGVYGIQGNDTSTGYELVEMSVKIRPFYREYADFAPDAAYAVYDNGRGELYVCISDGSDTTRAGQMLVYNMLRGAWTRYTNMRGRWFYSTCGCVLNKSSNEPEVWFMIDPYYGVTTTQGFILMNQTYPFDSYVELTYDSATHNPYTMTVTESLRLEDITEGATQKFYDLGLASYKERAIGLLPVMDYKDAVLRLAAVASTFGTGWFKTEKRNGIRLASATAVEMDVEPMMKMNGTLYSPVAVMVNGVIIDPADYTVTISTRQYVIEFAGAYEPTNGDTVVIGLYYPSWFYSPVFTRGKLNAKRLTDYIGLFDNREVSDDMYSNGLRKYHRNCDLFILYMDEQEGFTEHEIYEPSSNYWDDISGNINQQYKEYTRCHVPLFGSGYSFQVVHYSFSPNTFKLVGYEINSIPKKSKDYSKSE